MAERANLRFHNVELRPDPETPPMLAAANDAQVYSGNPLAAPNLAPAFSWGRTYTR